MSTLIIFNSYFVDAFLAFLFLFRYPYLFSSPFPSTIEANKYNAFNKRYAPNNYCGRGNCPVCYRFVKFYGFKPIKFDIKFTLDAYGIYMWLASGGCGFAIHATQNENRIK